MTFSADGFLTRLTAATNAHDVEGVVDCFTTDYVNETPVHPARGFTGNEQVRINWMQIFGGVPDLTARVLSHTTADAEVWSEWEMHGTRRDGTAHAMRGIIVFGLRDGRACRARFYLEPLDEAGLTVDEAVQTQVHAKTAP
jgi:ketosteroid isomerase-like protein